ncbi:RHS repeat-associated core domain-containing protein|uniref:RHS repeat-associated core domain-containing protein n=1 Tax=Pseudomonas sp. SbOxS1 TaxID=2723884 RepID=UPI0015D2D902|nr:RHS repeat-associated core domain-containing protein [Pseudomonas sp. SbOxS1]NYU01786.1 RHS repeat-associated core domain-containing protein [Pseudomonas sp. SbOxS1]
MPIARKPQPAKLLSAVDARAHRTLLLASDLQQSVLAELDRSGPNPFAYSPYGLQRALRRAGTHLGFNGQLKEGATGWYHLGNGHRVYSPVLMRFHSPDRLSPFGKGGLNAYAYCSGSPVNRVDPSGRSWLALLGNAVGSLLNTIFAGAAINRAAAAIVAGRPQAMITRIGNTMSFWGGASGVPSRAVGVPAAMVARMPDTGLSLGSNLGVIGGQVLTGAGALLQNRGITQTWMTTAASNGQSRWRVLWEATKEASGWNLLRGQAPGQVPGRAANTPMEVVTVEPRRSNPAVQGQQIRGVNSTDL